MSYVVTIFTEKHLYRVNIEEGTKYTIGSGEKDAFPMSELGPMCEIAPHKRHPVLKETMTEMLVKLKGNN